MKKLLAVVLLLSLLIPITVFAGWSGHDFDHEIACDLVWVSGTNRSEDSQMGYGFIKAKGLPVATHFTPSVAPGETITLSWEPPDGFVGSIGVRLIIWGPNPNPAYSIDGYIECHEYSLNVIETSDCEGYYRKINLRDYGKWIKSLYKDAGPWTDPYTIEMLPGLTVSISEEYGADVVFGDLYEPAECLVVLKHNRKIKVTKDCDGWSTTASSSDGGIATPLTPTSGVWLDPYTREKITVKYHIVWPDGYEKTVKKTFKEPKKCLVTLGHDFEIIGEADCNGWSFTASSNDGGVITPGGQTAGAWLDLYTLESASITYDVTWPDGFAVSSFDSVTEPEECLIVVDPSYEAEIIYDDCVGYCVEITPIQRGATVEFLDKPCGEWVEPHDIEEATVSFVIYQPDGSQETYEVVVTEPEHCWIDPCPCLFNMWLLEGTHPDANGILQCYVVSDPHPGVVRYQRICFPCLYPDFVASRSARGCVNACDVWELDYRRLYWRKPLEDLLAMNARHAAGVYYPIECEGCE